MRLFGLLVFAPGSRASISFVKVSFFDGRGRKTNRPDLPSQLWGEGEGGTHMTCSCVRFLRPFRKRFYVTNGLQSGLKMTPFWCFWEGLCKSGNYAPARTGSLLTTLSVTQKWSENDIQKTLGKTHITLGKYIENGLKMGSSWPHHFDVFGAQSLQELRN